MSDKMRTRKKRSNFPAATHMMQLQLYQERTLDNHKR